LFATLHGVVFHFFVRDAEVIFAIGADEAHARHRAQALRLLARGATGVAQRMNDLSDPASTSTGQRTRRWRARRGIPACGIRSDPLGILMTVNMEVGLCHPPVGLNLYVASGIARMGITELTIATCPWLVTMLIFLVMVTYIPEMSL
jgi:Tripartite ATP-independent periplasmic transporter, DctM component